MTSTPGLAATDTMVDSDAPAIAYATVYPIAMVLLIIVVQILSLI
jgi:putative transport protein